MLYEIGIKSKKSTKNKVGIYEPTKFELKILEFIREKTCMAKLELEKEIREIKKESINKKIKQSNGILMKSKLQDELKRTEEFNQSFYASVNRAVKKLLDNHLLGLMCTEKEEHRKNQDFYGLTDDSIKLSINIHKYTRDKFLRFILFTSKNKYRFKIKDAKSRKDKKIKNKFQKYNFEDNERRINVSNIFQHYEKQVLNISREYSSLIFDNYLKRLLEFIKKNKLQPGEKFWSIIEILGRKGTLNELEIIDSVFKPKNIIQRTNSRTFLNIFVDYGVLIPKIKPINVKLAKILRYDIKYELSPLGVLLFIKYVQKNKKEINLLVKNYDQLFPIIFKGLTWSKLKNLKTDVYNLLDTLSTTYFEGSELSPKVSQRRDLSSILTGYSLMPIKYRKEFKELYEIGIVVLEEYLQETGYWDKSIENYSEKFCSLTQIGSKDFFINHTPLADSAIYWARSMIVKINRIPPNERIQFKNYIKNPNKRIILSILDFLKQIIWLKDISDPNITTQKLDSTKFYFYDPTAIKSITNTISFHFFILLQAEITEKDWRKIIVDKKLNDWYAEFLKSINDCVHEIEEDFDNQIMIAKEVIN